MGRSVVYFTDMRATPERNLLQKFRALIERAGIADINFEKQFTAIKIHLGEPGNIAYLRPNFAKVVADKVKELGGKPFLTDSNTLYVGRRKDALEHLEAAYENGYNPFCTGCHVVIADGLKGTDEALVPVEGGEYIKEAKIGRAIAESERTVERFILSGDVGKPGKSVIFPTQEAPCGGQCEPCPRPHQRQRWHSDRRGRPRRLQRGPRLYGRGGRRGQHARLADSAAPPLREA